MNRIALILTSLLALSSVASAQPRPEGPSVAEHNRIMSRCTKQTHCLFVTIAYPDYPEACVPKNGVNYPREPRLTSVDPNEGKIDLIPIMDRTSMPPITTYLVVIPDTDVALLHLTFEGAKEPFCQPLDWVLLNKDDAGTTPVHDVVVEVQKSPRVCLRRIRF